MKVLVYPHDLEIGGSQLNAIELAAAVRDLGHEVTIFGRPGALVDRIHDLRLPFVESPEPGRRPSPRVLSGLLNTARDRQIDVIHGYEWPPGIEAWLACERLNRKTVSVTTVMSMAVAPFVPRTVPLIVGAEQIAANERVRGRSLVTTIEPPVDLDSNSAERVHGADSWLESTGCTDDCLVLVTVTRLARELKLEGILAAIDVVGDLARGRKIQLVIVGDGAASAEVAARAEATNVRVGKPCIVLYGNMLDPRPAYAAADIVLGMGGSALRAMAFGKPLVVQGESGFWSLLTPESVADRLWTGWYGVGQGPERGPNALRAALEPLLDDAPLRGELGAYGRRLVEDRFSLDSAAKAVVASYEAARDRVVSRRARMADLLRSGAILSSYLLAKKGRRLTGKAAEDDFNSKPVAACVSDDDLARDGRTSGIVER